MEPVTTTVVAAGWGIYQLLSWGVAAIALAYGTKKVTEAYGSNPGNNLSRNGIPQEQQYADYQEWLKNQDKYIKDKLEERFKDDTERRERLIEENRKLTEKLSTASPEEKVKFLEIISDNKKQISDINKNMAEWTNKIIKNFESIGRNPPLLTQEQFQDKSKQIDFTSWWSWGIIAFCVIIGILVINFVRKILSGFSKNFGS